MANLFGRRSGDQVGVSNLFNPDGNYTVTFPAPPAPNFFKGFQTIIRDTSTAYLKYGVYNKFEDFKGIAYGTYNEFEPETASTQAIYGSYTSITASAGLRYGSYFDVPGQTDMSFAAVFNNGSVVANEIGGNYDFRMESQARTHAFWLDADRDLVVLGTDTPDLSGNGANIAGTTVDFAADFDKGTTSGTAIGIGSREFCLMVSRKPI